MWRAAAEVVMNWVRMAVVIGCRNSARVSYPVPRVRLFQGRSDGSILFP
jgi:hypothetical protein